MKLITIDHYQVQVKLLTLRSWIQKS